METPTLKWVARGLLDALYPPVCLVCSELSEGPFPHCCPRCYAAFQAIGEVCCRLCGEPFTGPPSPRLCLRCMRRPPPYEWCRSLFRHTGAVAQVLAGLKYRRVLAHASPLQEAVVKAALRFDRVVRADLHVPVPMSWKGRLRRGFNQSYILCLPLARRTGAEVVTEALARRGNRKQVGLARGKRFENAAGSFDPGPAIRSVRGREVLLFDDVYTTGATVEACSRILTAAGASVSVLTLARAPR